MLFVGDDWAEDHHDIELQDVTGRVLSKAKLPEGVAGIARLHAMIGEHLGEDDEPVPVVVGTAISGSVMVDDEPRGELAHGKLTVKALAEGRHTVAIEADGYRRFEECDIRGHDATIE